MKKILLWAALAALVALACGDDSEPAGTRGIHYWDITLSSPDTVLTDIEMKSAKDGWACGYRYNAELDAYDGVVLHWDGNAWSVAVFLPGNQGGKIKALDFPTATDGWLLGVRTGESSPENPGASNQPFILHFDGSTWGEIARDGMDTDDATLLAALSATDVWVADGETSWHYDGATWAVYPITQGGKVDAWVFPSPEKGYAVDYDSGYCYKWDSAVGYWEMEPYPLYGATAFYFNADGSGVYADFQNAPPVGDRADFFERVAGNVPVYKKLYATNTSKRLTACDALPPKYYFFAGPNAAYEIKNGHVIALGNVPSSSLGTVRALSIAAEGNIWGIMRANDTEGPSFIVHNKKG
jgi:hypothetical protein